MKYLLFYLILFVSAFGWGRRDYEDKRRVLLKSIQTLTFYDDKYTTGQRSSPIKQMTCKSGYSKCKHMPTSIQCYNRGTDGVDVQWECKAQMENGYDLGRTEVSCEGYDYPDDPYILAGSCGVSFEVKQSANYYSSKRPSSYDNHHSYHGEKSFFDRFLSALFVVMAIAFIVFFIGLNAILKLIFGIFKIVLFPINLLSSCCCCLHGPAYTAYAPPPPPVFNNAFGNGLWWYNAGREDGHREAYRHYRHYQSDGVFHSHRDNWYRDDDSDNDHHESTSFASTSRR